MPMLRMTIKYVNSPLEGKSRGTIKDADGNKMLVMPHNLRLFEPGKTYDIAYTETGGWKTAQNATAVEASPPGATSTAAPSASVPCAGGTGGELKDEIIFACTVIKEGIRAGLITSLDRDTIALHVKHSRAGLRAGLATNTFTASEAGTFTSGAVRAARG